MMAFPSTYPYLSLFPCVYFAPSLSPKCSKRGYYCFALSQIVATNSTTTTYMHPTKQSTTRRLDLNLSGVVVVVVVNRGRGILG